MKLIGTIRNLHPFSSLALQIAVELSLSTDFSPPLVITSRSSRPGKVSLLIPSATLDKHWSNPQKKHQGTKVIEIGLLKVIDTTALVLLYSNACSPRMLKLLLLFLQEQKKLFKQCLIQEINVHLKPYYQSGHFKSDVS